MTQASVIGSSSVVRGDVRGEGSLEVLGRVEGDISVSGDVLVGEGGSVMGNIDGANVTVLGAVQGDLRGTLAVLVERGAKVAGDLGAPRIGIANGALVRGSVRTEGEPALTPARRPPAAPSRPSAFGARTHTHAETRAAAPAEAEPPEPAPPVKEATRRPPPPVLPALGKGAKAKKRKSREGD